MLGFSLKYIDSERMILDDWDSDFAVFDYGNGWDMGEEEDAETVTF